MITTLCRSADQVRSRRRALAGLVLVLVVASLLVGPQPQPLSYHAFADCRCWAGIPHAGDVLTNLAFVVAGLWGLLGLRRVGGSAIASPEERWHWRILFAAVVLTGLGSSWYHWAPSNASLVWDRLPLTICFAATLVLLWYEFGTPRHARRWAPALYALAPATVLWWALSGHLGQDDVRFYALLQLLVVLLTPLVVLSLPSRYSHGRCWLGVVLCYLLAKLAELGDGWLLAQLGLLSGHNLKHLIAAVAPLVLLAMLRRRWALDPAERSATGLP